MCEKKVTGENKQLKLFSRILVSVQKTSNLFELKLENFIVERLDRSRLFFRYFEPSYFFVSLYYTI